MKQLLRETLDAMNSVQFDAKWYAVKKAIKTELAKPEQEPVGYFYHSRGYGIVQDENRSARDSFPLYGLPTNDSILTTEEIEALAIEHEDFGFGRVDQHEISTHGFNPQGLIDFVKAIQKRTYEKTSQEST
jgi:hypothetical protein